MKYIIRLSLMLVVALPFFYSCGSTGKYTDTPTSGEVTITADETLRPIIDSQLKVFQALYRQAHVRILYKPEADCIKDLLNDTSKVIITARELQTNEKDFLSKLKYFPVATPVAKDAIAFITNIENPDTVLSMYQLRNILSGKLDNWEKLDANFKGGKITIVFDNKAGSSLRYIREAVLVTDTLSSQVFAASTNADVIEYIIKNKNAIGIIGVNWAKDKEDTTNLLFNKKFTVLGIKDDAKLNDEVEYPQPYQAYIQMGYYPLCRTIYCVNRESRSGLGTGFVSFIASDRGQRIFLKSGLVPATMPLRIVQLKKSNPTE